MSVMCVSAKESSFLKVQLVLQIQSSVEKLKSETRKTVSEGLFSPDPIMTKPKTEISGKNASKYTLRVSRNQHIGDVTTRPSLLNVL